MSIFSQNTGDVDLAFPVNTGFNNDNTVKCVLPQPDGKILVGGHFNPQKLVRLNSNGTLDSSFSNVIFSANNNINPVVKCLKLQNDGKIIVGGIFNSINGVTKNNIVRLNSDGTIDASFNIGAGLTNNLEYNGGYVTSIAIQLDGKIIVGGSFDSYNNISQNRLIRLNPDGSKDITFNIDSGFFNNLGWNGGNGAYVTSITIQLDGKIVVGGTFTHFKGLSQNGLIRLDSTGTKDTTFNIGAGFTSPWINKILVQSDGKVLIGGEWNLFNNFISYGIIRLNSNGTKDSSFNIGGNGFDNSVNDIFLDNFGKIIVVGSFTGYNNIDIPNFLIRLNSDGTKDTSFNVGNSFDELTNTISILNDNKILIGGEFTIFNGYKQNKLIRLNINGSVDSSFFKMWNDGNFGNNSDLSDFALQSDDKIIACGTFSKFNDIDQKGLIRLNSDGMKDTTFNLGSGFIRVTPTGIYPGTINRIVIQTNGKILVCGLFTSYNGTTMPNSNYDSRNLVRLNIDGSLDTSFNLPNVSYPEIALQLDGKIIGINGNSIVRFNTNGTLDNSFTANFNDASKLLVQPDGKILVGKISSGSSTDLIRLNSNGTIDTSFFSGSASAGGVQSLTYLPNGKILVGGRFKNFNSSNNVRGLVRLNNDGTVDSTFNASNIALPGFVRILYVFVQSDGKLLVGGDNLATLSDGNPAWSGLVRLNSNGSNDFSFNSFNNGTVEKVFQQSNGKILVAGSFIKYGLTESIGLIRLNGTYSLGVDTFNDTNDFSIYPNPTNDLININSLNNQSIKSVKVFDLGGKLLIESSYNKISVSNLSSGLYLLKITTDSGELTKKFIKE